MRYTVGNQGKHQMRFRDLLVMNNYRCPQCSKWLWRGWRAPVPEVLFRFACPNCGLTVQYSPRNMLKAVGLSLVAGSAIWLVLILGFVGTIVLKYDVHLRSLAPVLIVLPLLPMMYFMNRVPLLEKVESGTPPSNRLHLSLAFGALAYVLAFLFIGLPVILAAALESNWLRIPQTLLILTPLVAVGFLVVGFGKLTWHADKRIKKQEESQPSPPAYPGGRADAPSGCDGWKQVEPGKEAIEE